MSPVRMQTPGAPKFYRGGVSLYPKDELYREITFLAYYFHWSAEEICTLPHEERRRFCAEISALHDRMEPKRHNNPFEVD